MERRTWHSLYWWLFSFISTHRDSGLHTAGTLVYVYTIKDSKLWKSLTKCSRKYYLSVIEYISLNVMREAGIISRIEKKK